MSTANKLSYLNDTKSLLRTSLNKFGSNILSTDTFRSYDTKLNDIYDKLPKITQSGAGFTLENVQNGQVDDFKMLGVDLIQDGEPSPDYPQEIKVVEGRQVITDSSKNLLDSSTIEKVTQNGITCTYDSNKQEITFNGTCTYDNTLFNFYNTNILAKKDITKIIVYYVSGSVENYATLRFFDKNYVYGAITDITPLNSSNTKIVTPADDRVNTSNYVNNSFRFNNGSVANNFKIKVMVTDDENTDYEPYHEPVDYNIDLTNDLLKYSKCDFTPTTTSWYFLDSSGSAYGSDIGTKTNIKFPVEQNKVYTFRYNVFVEPLMFQLCYENEDIIGTITKTTGNQTFTFTSNRNGYVIPRVRVNASSQIKITDISVVKGEEDYYDYKLAKMPNTDYKNRIYKNNGNWYYEEKAKKVVLDGSENWYYVNNSSYSESIIRYRCDDFTDVLSTGYGAFILSSNFKGFPLGHRTENGIARQLDSSGLNIFIDKSITNNSLTNFKNWLSTNNVEVWYPLDNSTTTQITNTTLIDQLEAISVHTGTNIITISNDNNIIPEIEITRLKELEKLV